jgi:hypothetical protein
MKYKKDIVVAVITMLFLLIPLTSGYDQPGALMDEGTLLLYPELALKGKVPYRDFETFYGPANVYVLAGVYSVFGITIGAERSVGLIYRLAALAAIFYLVRRWNLILASGCVLLAGYFVMVMQLPAYAWMGGIACGLWSLWIGTSGKGNRRAFFAGLLAAFALLYRPDLGPSVLLSAVPILLAMARRERGAYVVGFAAGLSPLLLLTFIAGPAQIMNNLFIYPVIHSNPGRKLPIFSADLWLIYLLFIHIAAAVFNVVIGILSVRADRKNTLPRVLLSFSLFALGISHQALQRFDAVHLIFACFLSIGFLPVSIYVAIEMARGHSRSLSRIALAVVVVAALVEAASPELVGFFHISIRRGLAIEKTSPSLVKENGRAFPLEASNTFRTQKLLSVLQKWAAPGERLFVGPGDLSRTNYTDTFIYHLMPQLVPATYFLEMNPLSANRPNSRLAADVASADWIILDRTLDNTNEANESTRPGSDAPGQVVKTQFTLCGTSGGYDLYRKKSDITPKQPE